MNRTNFVWNIICKRNLFTISYWRDPRGRLTYLDLFS